MRTKKTLDVEVGKAGAREAGGKLLVNNIGRVKRYREEHLVNKLMMRFQPAIAGENSARRPFHRPLRRSLAQRADYQVLAFPLVIHADFSKRKGNPRVADDADS